MKKQFALLLALLSLMFCFTVNSFAINISLYVDSAPNVYGSPNWAPWWTQAKHDVVTGTFINMRTGTFPGTTTMSPYDEIVYNTGDLGKRLHWIYWLPGQSIHGLGSNFEVKWVIDWYGTNWTYSGGGWALDAPNIGWSGPSRWEDYSDDGGLTGVIGSLGFAWDGSGTDIDALAAQLLQAQTFAHGMIRYWNGSSYETMDIKVNMIPEPGTFLLLGFGLLGMAGLSRKKIFKKS